MNKLDSKNLRLFRIALICALIYGLVIIFGRQIYLYGDFQNGFSSLIATTKSVGGLLLIVVIVTALLYYIFKWYERFVNTSLNTSEISEVWITHNVRLWLINCGVLLISWLPCYFAYFPGILSYDIPEQICMLMGIFPSTTHQPPIHTILFGWSLNLGETIGVEPIIIYTLVQMTIMAAFYAYILGFLLRTFAKKNWEIFLIYLFFTINPIIPLMAIQPTKDTLFTCFFVICTIFIYEIITNGQEIKNYKYVMYSLFLALTSLFRNNAFYAIVLTNILVIIFIKMKRKVKIKTLAAVVLAILIINLFNSYTSNILGYEKVDDKVEMSAVPMSQLALVLTEDAASITEDEWKELSYFIKDGMYMVQSYNPRFYDPLKDVLFKTNLQEEYGRFIKLWWRLFIKHPVEYVRAFLNLNIPYWYPFADTIDPYSNRIYIETYIGQSPYMFERESKIPWLFDLYERIADYSMLDKPIIRIPFAINTPIWIMLLGIVFLIVKKEYRKIIVIMPSLFLWGTYLLGPVSNFRYIYPIFVLYPLFIMMVLHKDTVI